MRRSKKVGIKDLKNNLSAHLREVRAGGRLLVSDRDTVIAEIHEPGVAYVGDENGDLVLATWARAGAISLPTRPKAPLSPSPVRLKAGTAKRLLTRDRDESRP